MANRSTPRVLLLLLASCAPTETAPRPPEAQPLPEPPKATARMPPSEPSEPGTRASDPFHNEFTVADATQGMTGQGALVATIETSQGNLVCALFEDKAPISVANFVGLARGTRPFADPESGVWMARPAYDGTIFHRVIRGFMMQGGDPTGTGKGQPGYVFQDEIWPGARHDRAGLLCNANRGRNTNGIQFFITDAAAAHLDGNYTIFGECAPLQVVHSIANVDVDGERPVLPVKIARITISRKTP